MMTYELDHDVTTVGRIQENDLMIEDGSVSSHHAKITMEGGAVWVEDLDSTNGTKVNGVEIKRQQLRGGEQIEFGSIQVQFMADASTAPEQGVVSASMPGQTGAEEGGAMPAQVSRRPVDFASEAPFPKRQQRTDPMQVAALTAGIVALLVFAGGVALVYTVMRTPI